jgi:hypothetical protein
LHVSKILVVEGLGQNLAAVLVVVDRAVLRVEEGPVVPDLGHGHADHGAHGEPRRHRVLRVVDGAFAVDVDGREIEVRVAEDRLGQRHLGPPPQFGAEQRHRLRVGTAVQAPFKLSYMPGQVRDEVAPGRTAILRLRRMDLVPQVPGEQRARAAPALHREGEPALDELAGLRAEQDPRRARQRPAIRDVVGVVLPAQPGPEGIEGGEQEAQAPLLAQGEKVVPELDHARGKAAGRALDPAVLDLHVFEHQPQAGHAVAGEPVEVSFDTREVPAAEQPVQLDPGNGVVLADRRPGLAALRHEVGRARRDLDPRQPRRRLCRRISARLQGRELRRSRPLVSVHDVSCA